MKDNSKDQVTSPAELHPEEDSQALLIGAVLGDSDAESMGWSRAIGALSLQARDLRASVVSPIHVSVQFHVDGKLLPNEFVGVRTGRFNRKSGRLIVQAAVPLEPVANKRRFLLTLLEDAVEEADRYVRGRKLADGLPALRSLVKSLREGDPEAK